MQTIIIPDGAALWLKTGEHGISSKTILSRLSGLTIDSWQDHPHDPADFRRCVLLLEMVPEWQPRLGEMASASPVWAALVLRWSEIIVAFDAECPGWRSNHRWSAPKTYDLISSIIDEARR